jgi:hypothetical protein
MNFEVVTLDNWKPPYRPKQFMPKSNWRKFVVEDYNPGRPGLDDLRKIRLYLKKGASRTDIMQAFNIKRTVLAHIICDLYCPVDGCIESPNERRRRLARIKAHLDKKKQKPKVCKELDCSKKIHSKGLCQMHYTRVRTLQLNRGKIQNNNEPVCIDLNCGKPIHAKGLCKAHYNRMYKHVIIALATS